MQKLNVKVKRLVSEAVLPKKAHGADAGYDLTAVSVEVRNQGKIIVYHTGLAFDIPEGWCGKVYPRSSVRDYDLALANCVGIIDSGYHGEVTLSFRRMASWVAKNIYAKGDRVGQIVFERVKDADFQEVTMFNESERGAGGYGSTGK